MTYNPLDPDADPFKPPAVPTRVSCLHCGREYDSSLIEWRVETMADGSRQGFWCCPTPGCDGCGFGFDILPTDPTYRDERGGWVEFDEEDEEDWEEDEAQPFIWVCSPHACVSFVILRAFGRWIHDCGRAWKPRELVWCVFSRPRANLRRQRSSLRRSLTPRPAPAPDL